MGMYQCPSQNTSVSNLVCMNFFVVSAYLSDAYVSSHFSIIREPMNYVGVIGMITCICDVVILIPGVMDFACISYRIIVYCGYASHCSSRPKFRFKNDIAYSPYLITMVPRVSRT